MNEEKRGLTQEQISARAKERRQVIAAYVAGHPLETGAAVARALTGQITPHIVDAWAKETGHIWPKYNCRRVPVPVNLRRPAYLDSHVLEAWRSVLTESRNGRYVNQLANDATDALEAVDGDWLWAAAVSLDEVIHYVQGLRELLTDEAAREQGRQTWSERLSG